MGRRDLGRAEGETAVTTPEESTTAIAVSALAQATRAAVNVSPVASSTVAASVSATPMVSRVSQWGSTTIRAPSRLAPIATAAGASWSPGSVGDSSAQASSSTPPSSANARPAHPQEERLGPGPLG